jgi:hypothetical protein
MISFDKNKTLFLICDCGGEILHIEYDHEIKMADFAIFYNGIESYRMSLWQRLRYVYQILFHNKPYADQMILNQRQLIELQHFLESLDYVNRQR